VDPLSESLLLIVDTEQLVSGLLADEQPEREAEEEAEAEAEAGAEVKAVGTASGVSVCSLVQLRGSVPVYWSQVDHRVSKGRAILKRPKVFTLLEDPPAAVDPCC